MVVFCAFVCAFVFVNRGDAKPLLLPPLNTRKFSREIQYCFIPLLQCLILERTVFAVGAMVTDAVSKGADKQYIVKFNQRSCNSCQISMSRCRVT